MTKSIEKIVCEFYNWVELFKSQKIIIVVKQTFKHFEFFWILRVHIKWCSHILKTKISGETEQLQVKAIIFCFFNYYFRNQLIKLFAILHLFWPLLLSNFTDFSYIRNNYLYIKEFFKLGSYFSCRGVQINCINFFNKFPKNIVEPRCRRILTSRRKLGKYHFKIIGNVLL